uniref:40S ribosomal protein S7 n=1 Tax=Streblomastix strix TaxID=222440 RepID=Q1KYN5_9EUKA|nr:small subunit ribosomal protein 7 [Streblomastix strix]
MSVSEKIIKPNPKKPSELELSVAQTFYDIEHSRSTINKHIAPLKLTGAKEFEISSKQKALTIFIPFPQLAAYHRIQPQLVAELEKKLTGKHVLIVAKRRIIPKPKRGHKYTQPRPRTRTLANVHERILDDLCYPAEIVGKRIRYRLDGSKILKVQLDNKVKNDLKPKLESLRAVYQKLTGKQAAFEFAA